MLRISITYRWHRECYPIQKDGNIHRVWLSVCLWQSPWHDINCPLLASSVEVNKIDTYPNRKLNLNKIAMDGLSGGATRHCRRISLEHQTPVAVPVQGAWVLRCDRQMASHVDGSDRLSIIILMRGRPYAKSLAVKLRRQQKQ